MTRPATTISLKVPPQILERIPAAGDGRSRFILTAVEEKLERLKPMDWKPTTRRGKVLAELLKKGKGERTPLLNDSEFAQELAARRGRSL